MRTGLARLRDALADLLRGLLGFPAAPREPTASEQARAIERRYSRPQRCC